MMNVGTDKSDLRPVYPDSICSSISSASAAGKELRVAARMTVDLELGSPVNLP